MEIAADSELGRHRVIQLFRYLQAYHQVRNPIQRTVQDYAWRLWFWELPVSPCVRVGSFEARGEEEAVLPGGAITPENASDEDDFVLRVSRPDIKSVPAPPDELIDWLQPGWDKIEGETDFVPTRQIRNEAGQYIPVAFTDAPQRVTDFAMWQEQRRRWQQAERPAYDALTLFERIYELYGSLQREAERLELVLGDGILNWRRAEGGIHHPLLLQKLQLEFKSDIPEFTLRQTDHPTELYSPIFQTMTDVDGRIIAQVREELQAGGYHPLSGEDTSGFLRGLVTRLSARGMFVEEEPSGAEDFPRIGRSPVILLRNRTTGYATALEAILKQLPEGDSLPTSLQHIVGTVDEAGPNDTLDMPPSESGSYSASSRWGTADVLLSKPANTEQIQIAERLAQYGCVLVQGPPGTGKTHTIANLIGHLLAQGKTILVTSHTAKALRVLREQVVVPLQPLCVSVLESDSAGRSQLETSVSAIVERLSSSNAEQMEAEAKQLAAHRQAILLRLAELDTEILVARGNEYRSLVIAGREISPAEAARRIAEGRGKDDWIPAPVVTGASLPLSPGELTELYVSNTRLHAEDETQLAGRLPDMQTLPTPDAWAHLLQARERLIAQVQQSKPELWKHAAAEDALPMSKQTREHLLRETEPLHEANTWELRAVEAGKAPGRRQLWNDLFTLVKDVQAEALRAERALLERDPVPSETVSQEEQARILAEIIAFLAKGSHLTTLTLLPRPQWRQVIQTATVRGRKPETQADFEALQTMLHLT